MAVSFNLGGRLLVIPSSALCNECNRFSLQGMGAPCASGVTTDRSIHSSGMYKLEIELKRGHNLAVRDRGGRVTSHLFTLLFVVFIL